MYKKIQLGLTLVASTFAMLFPESGITAERIILTLVYSLAVVKMIELLEK